MITQMGYVLWGEFLLGKKISEEQELRNCQLNEKIKAFISNEMSRNNVTTEIVAQRLTALGRPVSTQALKNAISKGTHKTVWFIDLIQAITGAEWALQDPPNKKPTPAGTNKHKKTITTK